MVAPFLPEKEKVAAIRAELPATNAGIYLDAASAGPLPVVADAAMREWSDWEIRVGRGGGIADEEFLARSAEARGALAAIIVASPDQVSLAPGVGSAILLAAASRTWRSAGSIAVVGSLEPPVRSALDDMTRLTGARLTVADVPAGASPEGLIALVGGVLRDRPALIVMAHVSPADGRVMPIAEIARLAHVEGTWLAVDGSLAVGAIPVDVPALGADVYAIAGDRWLCGPSGVAAVYLAENSTSTPDLHRAAVVGLGRSAGWLAMQVGLEWASERTRRLVQVAREALSTSPGVALAADAASGVAATLAFGVAGWPPARLREELGRRVFALVGLTPDLDSLRIGLGCWNTDEEVARFCGAVRELAATTPEALPSRAPILVIPGDSA